jgi:hypothetical protein
VRFGQQHAGYTGAGYTGALPDVADLVLPPSAEISPGLQLFEDEAWNKIRTDVNDEEDGYGSSCTFEDRFEQALTLGKSLSPRRRRAATQWTTLYEPGRDRHAESYPAAENVYVEKSTRERRDKCDTCPYGAVTSAVC